MTAMPQMVALFNGVGGGAAALIALAEFDELAPEPGRIGGSETAGILLSALIGSISFSGSLVAFAKLQELVSGRPIVYAGQQVVNLVVLGGAVALARRDRGRRRSRCWTLVALIALALVFGVLFVLPIGGADMPVVISLLNAGTGIAASATGFALHVNVLIVSGALVGASGTLLTILMGRAMNRSLGNVLFGAFGQVQPSTAAAGAEDGRTARATTAEDVAVMLGYARRVVFVPGYGLAVAQAQHDVRALADQLQERGVDVKYAIHPVAGRMPGHMNVLLAEANVPYDELVRDGADQPGVSADGRGRRPRRERRRQPVGPLGHGQPHLRDAHPRRRPRRGRRGREAVDEPGLRRHRQPAVLRPEDRDAVRGRQGRARADRRRVEVRVSGIPFISGRDVERAVPPERALEAVRDAFVRFARGEWTMQPKLYVTNYPAGDFRAMPALGGGHALLKWVTSFPGNPALGLPTVTGLVLLSDAETGMPEAVLDAGAVTALRTGAAAVVAAETLARTDASTWAVVGVGVNGEATARMLAASGREPLLWDVDEERARSVAARVGGRAVASDEALGADAVVTVTPGKTVLYADGALRAGQHVSLMGADGPGKAEVAVGELARGRLFCDDWEQASHGGELAAAVAVGAVGARGRDGPRRRTRGCRRWPPRRRRDHAVRLHRARDPGPRDRARRPRAARRARRPALPALIETQGRTAIASISTSWPS